MFPEANYPIALPFYVLFVERTLSVCTW